MNNLMDIMRHILHAEKYFKVPKDVQNIIVINSFHRTETNAIFSL